jgi:AP2 domain.
MYSDFVGVTYNKTHAKFQACITHYRKQHYLGRYKLACDAAKAYDQSAKMLKGDAWKINFQSEEEYEAARERELKEVEEKRKLSGPEVENLRESFVSSFPSEAVLREKLGIDETNSNIGDNAPSGFVRNHPQGTVASKDKNDSNGENITHQAPMAPQPTCPKSVPTPASALNTSSSGKELSASGDHKTSTNVAPGTTNENQGLAKSAVTPSPNVFNNLTKNSSALMTEPLMSPTFKMGSSPSAHSLLGGTPFSMPGSSMKFNSTTKKQSENNQRDLGPVSSNIFQSPFMKDLSVSTRNAAGTRNHERNETMPKMGEAEDSDDKGKGDLTAASALLMMNGN